MVLLTFQTILDVFTEMEKQQQLTEDDVEKLEQILNHCDKQLAGKVEEYRLSKTGQGRFKLSAQYISIFFLFCLIAIVIMYPILTAVLFLSIR